MGLSKIMKPFEDVDVDACLLGQDPTVVSFSRKIQMVHLAATMISQAGHEVIFYADQLDDSLIGESEVVDALSRLIIRNRSARIRTLVKSSQQLVHSGHRIVELLRGHMPEAECRNRSVRSDGHTGSFIVIDRLGYLYIPKQDRFVGSACFYNTSTVENLYDVFEQEWQVASPDPEMQQITL